MCNSSIMTNQEAFLISRKKMSHAKVLIFLDNSFKLGSMEFCCRNSNTVILFQITGKHF